MPNVKSCSDKATRKSKSIVQNKIISYTILAEAKLSKRAGYCDCDTNTSALLLIQ